MWNRHGKPRAISLDLRRNLKSRGRESVRPRQGRGHLRENLELRSRSILDIYLEL